MSLHIMNRKQRFYFLGRLVNQTIAYDNADTLPIVQQWLDEMEELIHTDKMRHAHDDLIEALARQFPEEYPEYVIVTN